MRYKVNPLSGQELRQVARKMYSALNHTEDPTLLTADDVQRLLEDLAVSKIQLEMQNEHLQDLRAKLESALTQTAEIFDFASVALVCTDAKGTVLKANFALAQMLGIERSKLLGMQLDEFFPQDQRDAIRYSLSELPAISDNPPIELTVIVKDLPSKQVQMAVSHLSQSGNCIVTLSDVTERKRDQVKALEQLHQSKLLVELASDGIWIWNVASAEVGYSARLTQLYGYSVAEFGHTLDSWRSRVHPADQSAFLHASQTCLTGQCTQFSCEQRVQCKNGTWKWILCSGTVLARAPDGSVLSLTGIHTDISIRKQAERENLETLAQQQGAFDALGTQIALLNDDGTVMQTNFAWRNSMQAVTEATPCRPDSVGSHFAGVLASLVGGSAQERRRAIRGTAEVLSGAKDHFRQAYVRGHGDVQRWFLLEAVHVRDGRVSALLSHQDITRVHKEMVASEEDERFLQLGEQEFQRAQRYGSPLMVLSMAWRVVVSMEDDRRATLEEILPEELKSLVRPALRTSDLLGRTGRHTFALVLPDTSLEGGSALAQRCVDQVVNKPIELFGKSVPVSVSVGACLLEDDPSFAALLKRTEAALREVRESRGYGVVVDPTGSPCLW